MSSEEALLKKLEGWWRDEIYTKHKVTARTLSKTKNFSINPFLHPYIANFVYGDTTPISLAKALILPRIMGTSVTTSFGKKMQKFIVENIDHAKGSGIDGIDIEFEDQTRPNKDTMYCQLKAGPNTINSGNVKTIAKEFRTLRNKARLDHLEMAPDTSIVGVLYGTRNELSGNYLAIENEHGYSVYVGVEFWTRLTGNSSFYSKMDQTLRKVSLEVNEAEYLQAVIEDLAKTDEIIALSKFDEG